MLKRVTIISAILVVVCLIASAVLFPLAVGDSVEMARAGGSLYSQPVELFTQDGSGVGAVSISNGWLHRLEVRPSNDGAIRLYTDGYNTNQPVVTGAQTTSGDLQLFLNRTSYSGFNLIGFGVTRDELKRGAMAFFNERSTDSYVLELPPEVAFNTLREGNRRYNNLVVHPGVKVLDMNLAAEAPLQPGAAVEFSAESWEQLADLYEREFDLLYDRAARGEFGSIDWDDEGTVWLSENTAFFEQAEDIVSRLCDALLPESALQKPLYDYALALAYSEYWEASGDAARRLVAEDQLTAEAYQRIELELGQRELQLETLAQQYRAQLGDVSESFLGGIPLAELVSDIID